MKFSILTLFPEIYEALSFSVIGRAIKNQLIDLSIINIRDFSKDKHKKCDDTPYGGGAGMVMTPQPIYDSVLAEDPDHKAVRVFVSPKGEKFNQNIAAELSNESWVLFINGYYEGVDQRVVDLLVDREISIGDYIISSGDYATMVLINSISRLIPNVLGSEDSIIEESFHNSILEYPHYTRPYDFMGLVVPTVLTGGNHQEIEKWRKAESKKITRKNRPDLMPTEDDDY